MKQKIGTTPKEMFARFLEGDSVKLCDDGRELLKILITRNVFFNLNDFFFIFAEDYI